MKNNFANIQAIVEIEKEKIFEINSLGNLDNPEIQVLSSDKSIDMSFNINDINQEAVFQFIEDEFSIQAKVSEIIDAYQIIIVDSEVDNID